MGIGQASGLHQFRLADAVTLDGTLLTLRGPRYFMLNKPAGVVSATEDGEHRTVLDLLHDEDPDGLHIAGRLDIDTTGLVLITDDGQWSHRVKAPGRHEKRYRVHTARPIADDAEPAQPFVPFRAEP